MAVPTYIWIWDPEADKVVKARLVGEHGPYFVYESLETGYNILVPKGEVWRFEKPPETVGE